MKIFVLGSTGMLGKYMSSYLGQKFDVVQVSRKELDASSVTATTLPGILTGLGVAKGDVLINCMGTIKTRVDELGDLNAILVNAVFPRFLSEAANTLGVHLIHPTTDCVYLGLKGSYSEEDKYDVNDVYGMSKALGETKTCTVIRTSIIGEEVGQKRSLVEWVKSSANQTVFGFTNHFWNGVTCLELAKICEKIINNNAYWMGIRHIHSNTLSKKELVELISDVYDLHVTVTPKDTPVMCDRSLSTIYPDVLESFEVPSLSEQVKEMKEFSTTLYK